MDKKNQLDVTFVFFISLLIVAQLPRWAGHVARMGEERGVYRVLVGKPEGKSHWGDLGVDGWIIFGPRRDEVKGE